MANMSVIHFCLSIACLTLSIEERADPFVETQNTAEVVEKVVEEVVEEVKG